MKLETVDIPRLTRKGKCPPVPRLSLAAGIILAAHVSLTGCAKPLPEDIKVYAKRLDDLAEKLEEYGSIAMSAPAMSAPGLQSDAKCKPADGFTLNRPATAYFDDARKNIQGAAAALTQQSLYSSGQLTGQFDPLRSAQYTEALRRYHQNTARNEAADDLRDKANEDRLNAILGDKSNPDPATQADKLDQFIKDSNGGQKIGEPTFPVPDSGGGDSASSGSGGTSDSAGDQGGAQPAMEANKVLADGGAFKGVRGLLPKDFIPTISNREALLIAAGDKSVETTLRLLANPTKSIDDPQRVLLTAAATVSVNPGWRTKEDFAADFSVQVSWEYKEASDDYWLAWLKSNELGPAFVSAYRRDRVSEGDIPSLFRCTGECPVHAPGNPLVVAVSPLTDSQTLQLSSSLREMQQWSLRMAASLRAAGQEGQADALEEYVKSKQRDVSTANAVGVANAYSASGGVFGYQVGPRLRGLADPAEGDESANIMERQTFPVLILIAFDRSELRPRIKIKRDAHGRSWPSVYEPVLKFTQTARWIPLDLPWYAFSPDHRLSEVDRLELSYRLNSAGGSPGNDKTPAANKVLESMDDRTIVLKGHLFGNVIKIGLPPQLGLSQPPKASGAGSVACAGADAPPALSKTPPTSNSAPSH
jgi:hypothetical protein